MSESETLNIKHTVSLLTRQTAQNSKKIPCCHCSLQFPRPMPLRNRCHQCFSFRSVYDPKLTFWNQKRESRLYIHWSCTPEQFKSPFYVWASRPLSLRAIFSPTWALALVLRLKYLFWRSLYNRSLKFHAFKVKAKPSNRSSNICRQQTACH